LVGAREARELPQVGVAATAVPVREDSEVVVVFGDDALAEQLQRQLRGRVDEAVEPLPEGTQQTSVTLGELRRQRLLDAGEDRPLARGATDEHERVIGRTDERR